MSEIVEMFRSTDVPGGRDRYSCSLQVWELLLELGRTFGWHPAGATYVMPPGSKVDIPARRNYDPSRSQDHKRVEQEDAAAWGRALERAKASPHVAAMLESRSSALLSSGKVSSDLLPGVLDEFIEFVYGGPFQFVLSSEGLQPGADVEP